jgi:hypothetical protein
MLVINNCIVNYFILITLPENCNWLTIKYELDTPLKQKVNNEYQVFLNTRMSRAHISRKEVAND